MFDDYSPIGTILLNTKNNKYYIIIKTSYNGDDKYYSHVDVIELDLYNKLGQEFKISEIKDDVINVCYASREFDNYKTSGMYHKIEQEIIYKKDGVIYYV